LTKHLLIQPGKTSLEFPTSDRILYAYTLNDPVQAPETSAKEIFINDLMHFRNANMEFPW
jgi:hypothetical protein